MKKLLLLFVLILSVCSCEKKEVNPNPEPVSDTVVVKAMKKAKLDKTSSFVERVSPFPADTTMFYPVDFLDDSFFPMLGIYAFPEPVQNNSEIVAWNPVSKRLSKLKVGYGLKIDTLNYELSIDTTLVQLKIH